MSRTPAPRDRGAVLPLVLVVTVVLSLGVGSLLWFSRWFHREEDMGSVSAQWLFEYRQNEES